MIDPKLTGSKTEIIPIRVTREEIQTYVKAIGEKNKIFYALDSAKEDGFSDIVIPPTYPTLLWQLIEIPWLQTVKSIIQTEQKFKYNEILIANVTYACQIILLKVRNRGNKQFLKLRLEIRNYNEYGMNIENEALAISDTTIVLID